MKKIAKLSLVAAVAVAGLTNVNAASLEEAIKGVDVSGQFKFRAQEKSDKKENGKRTSSGNNGTEVDIEIGVKVPVTEQVTAVFKIDNSNDDTDDSKKAEVKIEDYYFSYAQDELTVNFGQQNIPGRMTDGAQGDGIVALYNLGAVTIGSAAFMTNSVGFNDDLQKKTGYKSNKIKAQDVYSVIAMANAGPISLLGQYATVKDTLGAYNVKADAAIEMFNVGVEYTAATLDKEFAKNLGVVKNKRSTLKTSIGGEMGILSADLTYAKTGKNGSGSIDNQTTTNTDTEAEALLWNIGTSNIADASMFILDTSAAVTDKISLRAAYLGGKEGKGTNNKLKETLGQVSYKVAKNLSTYFRYADVKDKNKKYNRGRIQVKYSF